jgi:anaerobic selenocysteine-containing dehydrogenase
MALQALTGNFGRLGAGVVAKPGLAFPKTTDRLQRPDFIPPGTRCFNIVDVPRHILDGSLAPPVAALFIYNHNPVATHPDQNAMRRALLREDLFIVGADVAMTDSMAYADVILPAASHFEFDDVYGAYGHSYLQRAAAAIPCVGQSLPNTEIFRRLAARFGFSEPAFRDSDKVLMDDALKGDDPRLEGISPSALPLDRALPMAEAEGSPLIMCSNLAPATASGKIELFSEDLEARFGCGLPAYRPQERPRPFNLISPSSAKRTNATFGGCRESGGPEIVELHPADAAVKGIADGMPVRLWNDLGEVELVARISDAVRPGVLYSPKGTWLVSSVTGQTVNALIPVDLRADIEGGAAYNETYVDLRPAAP